MRKLLLLNSDSSTGLSQAFCRPGLSFSSSVRKPLNWPFTSSGPYLPVFSSASVWFLSHSDVFFLRSNPVPLGFTSGIIILKCDFCYEYCVSLPEVVFLFGVTLFTHEVGQYIVQISICVHMVLYTVIYTLYHILRELGHYTSGKHFVVEASLMSIFKYP